MRVFVINPDCRSVEERDIDATLAELQEIVGGNIEGACRLPNGDVLYVNEEGLFRFSAFFDIGAHQPFAGPGVVVGAEDQEGRHSPARSSLAELRGKVTFLSGPTLAP